MFENLEEKIIDLLEYISYDIYWNVEKKDQVILENYIKDFEEYFMKKGLNEFSERLKDLLQ